MSPRSTQENQRVHEEQKERILSAALPVFAQKGLAATRMADIAEAAAMGYGSVYHYFADKEAIFTALIEKSMQESAKNAQEALEKPGTAWERLHWWFSRAMTWTRKHPEIVLFLTQVLTNEPAHPELRTLVYQLSRVSHNDIRQLIVEGQAEGQVAAGNPDQLTIAVHSCLQGFAIEAALDPEQANEHAPDVEILLRLLKA
jgi:AcrR family transcriptional regulator